MKLPNKLECDRQKPNYSAEGQTKGEAVNQTERERDTHAQPRRGAHAAGHPQRAPRSLHTCAQPSWGGNGGRGNVHMALKAVQHVVTGRA